MTQGGVRYIGDGFGINTEIGGAECPPHGKTEGDPNKIFMITVTWENHCHFQGCVGRQRYTIVPICKIYFAIQGGPYWWLQYTIRWMRR
jgi:hypothetical protein